MVYSYLSFWGHSKIESKEAQIFIVLLVKKRSKPIGNEALRLEKCL